MPRLGGGVQSVKRSGSPALGGDVVLAEGSNVTLTQTGQQIAIAATGGVTPLSSTYIQAPAIVENEASTGFPATTMVWLVPITIPVATTIDRLFCAIANIAAGNVRIGLFGPVAVQANPDGSALVAQTGATLVTGTFRPLFATVPDTALAAGYYWLALQVDDLTLTVRYISDGGSQVARVYTSGGFGAFTNPCPATTPTSGIAILGMRTK